MLKVMILKSSLHTYNIILDSKVLKGSGIYIKLSHAFNHETKPFNMAIQQVLANNPSPCFFCKAHGSCLIGVINILPW